MQIAEDAQKYQMAIPQEHQMEQLHLAYVIAVAALSGTTFDPPRQDYGIDGKISEVQRFPNGKYRATNWHFACQLKATTNFKLRNDIVAYEMEAEAYNRLVLAEGNTSRILVLFCLPKDWANWVELKEEQLI